MNKKLAIILVFGFSVCCGWCAAQPEVAPQAQEVPPASAVPVKPDENANETKPSTAPADLAEKPKTEIPAVAIEPAIDLGAKPATPASPDIIESLTLDHDLLGAIASLARLANLNIHIDPSVTFTNLPDGKSSVPMVSLRWQNITAQDALVEVLDIHGLALVKNPKTQIARVTKKSLDPPRISTMVQLKYSNPTNVMDLIKSLFTDPVKSKVNADPRTSQLLLLATERETEAATNLIAQLDTPTKQVLIEARLLETSKNPRSIKGIDWSGTLEGQNIVFGNGRTTGTTTTQTPGQSTATTLPSGRTVTSTSSSSTRTELLTQLGLGGISADTARGLYPGTAFLNADGVRAVLSFLNTDADTEVVATPRQVTADNQTAILSVTRAYPIFETTPGTAQTPPSAKITYTNLGTILRVTPRIAASSNIVLKVVPEVSNIDSKDRQIINGEINEANVYAIRKMETEVMIPSGNTLVMGGLISDNTTRSYSKVPLLGDLPGIGLAFRRDTKTRAKANLIIFVTPTIVRDFDFQPTATDFLQNKPKDKPDTEESAWNSGKPHNWKKPVK
jgi:type IV pilus assembly protein PilQ